MVVNEARRLELGVWPPLLLDGRGEEMVENRDVRVEGGGGVGPESRGEDEDEAEIEAEAETWEDRMSFLVQNLTLI